VSIGGRIGARTTGRITIRTVIMGTDTGPTSRTLTDMARIDTDMGRTSPIRPMADMGCGTTPGTMCIAHIASSDTIVTDWRVKSSAKSLMPDVRRALPNKKRVEQA
jgi:hypothetical protein